MHTWLWQPRHRAESQWTPVWNCSQEQDLRGQCKQITNSAKRSTRSLHTELHSPSQMVQHSAAQRACK